MVGARLARLACELLAVHVIVFGVDCLLPRPSSRNRERATLPPSPFLCTFGPRPGQVRHLFLLVLDFGFYDRNPG